MDIAMVFGLYRPQKFHLGAEKQASEFLSILDAEMTVSQPLDGIFGVCKGLKPSEFDGPITGQ